MSNLYGTVKHGDEISPGWMQDVEDATGAGTPAKKGSYHIWTTDNSTFYARNGRTGERESGDDIGDLINEKILALYNAGAGTGGTVTIGPYNGKISLNKTINMRPGVYLDGEARGTNLNIYSTALFATADITMVKFDPPSDIALASHGYYGGISNLRLDGDGKVTSYPIIDINPSTNRGWGDIELNHLTVDQGKYGLRINNNTTSELIWDIFVEDCFFEQCTYAGLLVDSPTDQAIKQCRFTSNHFFGNNTSGGNGAFEIDGHNTRGGIIGGATTFELENRNGIYMADEADGWAIGDIVAVDCGEATTNTYSGIKLVDVDFVAVNGCVLINRANNKMKYGFESDNNCTYLSVFGNTLKGQSGGGSQGTSATNRPLTADFTSMNACATG